MTERTDDEALARISQELLDAVDSAVEAWVSRCVSTVCAATGIELDGRLRASTTEAAAQCRAAVADELSSLLSTDIDEQRGTPLQVLRAAVRFPTRVLWAAGVVPLRRDDFEQRAFPDDLYGLTPSGFADVDPILVDPGIAWGAAKAHVHLSRRRSAEG